MDATRLLLRDLPEDTERLGYFHDGSFTLLVANINFTQIINPYETLIINLFLFVSDDFTEPYFRFYKSEAANEANIVSYRTIYHDNNPV